MRIKTSLKSNFTAGLVLVGPLVVTLVILRTLLGWLGGLLDPIVEGTRLATQTGDSTVLAQLLALGIIAALVTVLGFLAQRTVGKRIFGRTGRLVDFLPVFRTIYGASAGWRRPS